MKKLQIITLFLLFLVQLSCARNNDLLEASKKLCECFENYSEEDSQTMNKSIQLIDSLKVSVNSIPKNILIVQLNKDCPKSAFLIEKLAD